VVEITPQEDGFERRLTCWHESGSDPPTVSPLPEEEIERIAKLYETHATIDDGSKHVFTGRFQGEVPCDIGGAGSYTRFVTPLGTLSAYVERYRGDDDFSAAVERRHAAADQLTELAIGWFGTELGREPGFPLFKRFLDENLRSDLKNVGLYAWAAEALAEHEVDVEEEFTVRLAQYLVERDYLTVKELPSFVRAFSEEDSRRLAELFQGLVARKMGVEQGQPMPDSLARLSDPERLVTSLADFIRTTDLYKERLEAWEQQKNAEPETDAERPDPMEVVTDLAVRELLNFSLSAADSLEVKLHSGVEPFAANGKWDEESAAVTWSETLSPQRVLPLICFAVWSCPDREAQEARFGKVLLTGQELAEYVLWYKGLDSDETVEWDRFVESCKPSADLRARLESFRFTADPQVYSDSPEDEQPASLADTARQLILGALDEADDEEGRQ
jgi:hypothetical protein